jgi:phosphoglycolate phosphatase
MLKYILFDFDGTVADSRAAFISAFNTLAGKYRFKKIDEDSIPQLKSLSMLQRLQWLNVPLYRIPFLTPEFLSLYRNGLDSVIPVPGIEEVFTAIDNMGLKAGIVSSNAADTIKSFLHNNGMTGIADVVAAPKLFGKDRVLRKFAARNRLAASELLYVCDEQRDVQACNKAGVKTVWVRWGFEEESALQGDRPSFIADDPGALVSIIEKMQQGLVLPGA